MTRLFLIVALTLVACPAKAQYWHGHGGGGGAFIGGVIGGIIGNVFRPPYQPYYPADAISYCLQRFRSYNPETGFYLGFDGRYHRCP